MQETPEFAGGEVSEPFSISLVGGRYMLYDVNVVSYIRRVYHMCGCLVGTLPQIPQQNVFLGLPLELMVEEAALLVEKGAGYIVDDTLAHKSNLQSLKDADKQAYLAQRELELNAHAEAHQAASLERKAKALEKKGLSKYLKNNTQSPTPPTTTTAAGPSSSAEGNPEAEGTAEKEEDQSLFTPAPPTTTSEDPNRLTYHTTPTPSNPLYHHLPTPPTTTPPHLIPKPTAANYNIYKHLHEHGYYLSPALRFGAKFMAYPGDPLRFHSHFVVKGVEWEEEIDVMEIVGGGRLGTGVKKGWMVGGKKVGGEGGEEGEGETRVFSVEWGGF
ncbi:hypothetical protein DFH27DRAFT_642662 [Peziza echinospora]|nr:hypothetical protein DFH27DRAFT_642662 [Peziza echinospora]